MTLLDLCSYLGLGAVGAIAVNMLLGLLMSLRYSPVRMWPRRKINVFALHQWTAWIAVVLVLAHPAVLLLLKAPKFRVVDVLWPLHSYLQPKMNFVGAMAAYLVIIVLVTSLLRTQIGRPVWRSLHYLVFPALVLLLVHSVFTDPNLKDGKPDLLDGGKLFLYAVALALAAAISFRVARRGRGLRAA